jgi:hypothetical protein
MRIAVCVRLFKFQCLLKTIVFPPEREKSFTGFLKIARRDLPDNRRHPRNLWIDFLPLLRGLKYLND